MRPRYGAALLAAAALLAGVPTVSSAAVGERCNAAAAGPRVDVPTFSVSVSAGRPSYRRGQTAVVRVEVRHASPAGPKVERVQVDIDVSAGGHVVKRLHGQTDAEGISRPAWKLPPRAPLGRLSAVATVSLLLVDSVDCTGGIVYETGRGTADPLTTVTS